MRPPIWTWRRARSCSARSVPPDSAAPRTRRVLVHRSQLAELQRRLVHAYRQVRIGDPLDPTTLVGPLIDSGAVRGFERAIGAAQAAGGELLVGGKVLHAAGPLRRAGDHRWRATTGTSCSTRPSGRFCT